MARRSDHSREELKEMAIRAGLDILEKEGFAGFSARKVAGRIGYTVGTLYHVFGTYDDFILHVNGRTLDTWYDAMQEMLHHHTNPDPLHAVARFYIHYARANYHAWIALFEHHMRDGHDVPEWYLAKMTRLFTEVERIILPLVRHDSEKASRAARVMWAGIHGITILSLSGKLGIVESETAETLADSFMEHYLAGLMREA